MPGGVLAGPPAARPLVQRDVVRLKMARGLLVIAEIIAERPGRCGFA